MDRTPLAADKQAIRYCGLASALKIDDDGLIRLTFAQLEALPIEHMFSSLKEDQCMSDARSVSPTSLDGHTVWYCENGSALTLAWTWRWFFDGNMMRCRLVNLSSSNIQLLEDNYDVSPARNEALLKAYLAKLDWQRVVLHSVCHEQELELL